jgi:hypothetical protein
MQVREKTVLAAAIVELEPVSNPDGLFCLPISVKVEPQPFTDTPPWWDRSYPYVAVSPSSPVTFKPSIR